MKKLGILSKWESYKLSGYDFATFRRAGDRLEIHVSKVQVEPFSGPPTIDPLWYVPIGLTLDISKYIPEVLYSDRRIYNPITQKMEHERTVELFGGYVIEWAPKSEVLRTPESEEKLKEDILNIIRRFSERSGEFMSLGFQKYTVNEIISLVRGEK